VNQERVLAMWMARRGYTSRALSHGQNRGGLMKTRAPLSSAIRCANSPPLKKGGSGGVYSGGVAQLPEVQRKTTPAYLQYVPAGACFSSEQGCGEGRPALKRRNPGDP
jgi:hypothetical protein